MTTVGCIFKTKEEILLYQLLNKFIAEKTLICGLNVQNQIAGAYATSNGIVFTVPDNKVYNSIVQLYKYLMTKQLSAPQLKCVGAGSYNKLHSDIKNFEVFIVGKCRTSLKALTDNTTKISVFTKAMSAIEPVKFDDFEVNVKGEFYPQLMKVELKGFNDKAKFMFAVCYAGLPFVVDGNMIKLLDATAQEAMAKRGLVKNTFSPRVKAFVSQFGIPSSGSDAKTREKNNTIVDSVNISAELFGKLYGVEYRFKNASDVKEIDSEAIGMIKKVKV
jgi:hypothetical protein